MSIADKITQLNNIKINIKQAIIDKGVDVTDSTPFGDYAEKIGEISGGGPSGKFVVPDGIKFGRTTLPLVPPELDFSECSDFSYMFAQSSITDFSSVDWNNARTLEACFYASTALRIAPPIDTWNVSSMYYMFYGCTNLTSIPAYDGSSITSTSGANLFGTSSSYQPTKVTSFGGLIGTKYGYSVRYMTNLTAPSLMNIINGLYDFSDGTPHTTAQTTLTLGTSNLNKLSASQKAVATSKGWTLQ